MTRDAARAALTWATALAAGLVCPTSARAQAEDTGDAELESAIQSDVEAGGATTGGGVQALLPDISFIADFALAWFSSDDNLQTGGHDPTVTGFNLQQLEMSVSSVVDPYFRFDSNIVFGLFGVEVEEAYGTTLDLPAHLQLRAGQFLTRFGRINATHPHSWQFVDQPFAIGRVFGAEGNRGLGAEVSWLAPLPWYVEPVLSATMANGEATARSFYGAQDLGVDSPADVQYTAALKQFFPLGENNSLLFGLSAAAGPNATGRSNRTELVGTDLYYKFRPVTYASHTVVSVQTEWLYRRRQVPEDVLSDVSGYAQVFYRFVQRWGAAARYEFGSAARGEDGVVADDYLDPEWTAARHRVAANLTYWPTEFSRLRLQGSSDFPLWRDEPVLAAFLALELVTGAHGSHPF